LPKVLSTIEELLKYPYLVLTIEYRFKQKNGTWNWIESTFSNHLGEEGIKAIVINFRDISERKKAEKELQESEEKFKKLVWDMQVGVILQNSNAEIILCNPMALELLGLSENQLLGITSFDPSWNVIHEDGTPFPGSTHPVPRAIATKKAVRNEVMGVYRPNTNDRVWIHVDAEPVIDSEGNVSQVVCTFVDITIRKKAEEELILKNLVFEESIAANSISDLKGLITNVNSAFVKTWGYSNKEEVLGKPISEFLEYEKETAVILNSLSVSGKYSGEYTARKKDKSTFHAFSLATVVYDNSGNIIGYQSSVQDITGRHLAEAALRENEKKYRYLFEINPNVMWIYDLETLAFLEVNEAAVTNYGYTKEEFLKMTIRDIRPEEDIPILMDDVAHTTKLLNKAGTWRHKKKSGEIIFVEIVSHLTEYEKRKARLVIANDITERKLAQETLMLSEEKFRILYENMKQGVFYQLADGTLIDINPAGLELFGLTRDQFMGRTSYHPEWKVVDEKFQPLKPEEHPSMVALHSVREVDKVAGVYNPQLKSYKWLSVSAKPQFMNDSKKPYQVFVTMHDITDLVQAEEMIRNLNNDLEKRVFERTEQLEHVNKELEAFSYSVSHDLRAPLRAIHSFTTILREDYGHILDDEGKRICGVIETSTVHMGQLIDDLLAFSRIGRMELGSVWIDMTKLMKSVFYELTTPGERKLIRFKLNKLPTAQGDSSTLKQAVTNLVSNAVKYSSRSEHPEIEIGSIENKHNPVYYIRDNGVGFDMQYAHKLFGVFQRLHSSKEFEGNGVGLAIVQRIINRHGGRIWAEGEVGKGAVFYFTLQNKDKSKKTKGE
jgi:PAS domain S-box-containing protein